MSRRADVLAVDDEPQVLRAVERTLAVEQEDLLVETCSDPLEAVEILKENPPKVLISDYRMPGMNGVELLQRATEITPDTVRILLTGYADREQVIEAINAGKIFRFVSKPWDQTALGNLAREAIDIHDRTVNRKRSVVVRRELEAAVSVVGEIQRSLLPTDCIHVVGAEAACSSTPCEHATGDYVDALVLPDGRTALIMGDVCGHGLGAALFVFTARALLRCGLMQGEPLDELLDRTNKFLCRDMSEGRFLTLFVAIHDPVKQSLNYVNAGHTPTILLRANGPCDLTRTGLPLGVIDHCSYEHIETIPFSVGETMFAYTDGIIEARNFELDELYGRERLRDLLVAEQHLPPTELLARVREDVHAFTCGAGVDDDLTLLVYRPLPADAKLGTLVPV